MLTVSRSHPYRFESRGGGTLASQAALSGSGHSVVFDCFVFAFACVVRISLSTKPECALTNRLTTAAIQNEGAMRGVKMNLKSAPSINKRFGDKAGLLGFIAANSPQH
jgi:hypothetical protein